LSDITKLEGIVRRAMHEYPDCSDIQFVGGGEVWVHENAADKRTDWAIADGDVLGWAEQIAHDKGGAAELTSNARGSLEKAFDIAGVRLRMTWRRQFGGVGLNVRILPQNPPALESPRFAKNPIPQVLVDMVLNNTDGIILFEGPTGSGKTTMQAALVNEVNRRQQRHIYTLEDPIEVVHTSQQSLITQREVGTDVDSFPQGLMTAKRSKPGIILLGELRDRVTMRAALESAGEGHLVLATSHASAVPEAVSTFIGAFPSDEQNEVAQRMSVTLRGVIVQKLIPSTDGKVVPVREMLRVTDNIASKIAGDTVGPDLRAALLSTGNRDDEGIFSRDDDLLRMVVEGHVHPDVAVKHAFKGPELLAKINSRRALS